MKRWAQIVIVALFLLTILIPSAQSGLGSRITDLIIEDIMIDEPESPLGTYSVGVHDLRARINNTGTEDILEAIEFNFLISYSENHTAIFNETVSPIVFIIAGNHVEIDLIWFNFPEGEFDIMVNGTFSNGEFFKHTSFLFEDYDDMEILGTNITESYHYLINSPIIPEAKIEYETNQLLWANPLSIKMTIEDLESSSNEIYNNTVQTEGGPGKQYTAHIFDVPFPEWIPNTNGRHQVRLEILYSDMNMSNNVLEVEIYINNGPSIQGLVDDASGQPLKGVYVEFIQIDVMWAHTYTDMNGSYTFDEIPLGDYEVSFSKEWYLPANDTISITSIEKVYLNRTLVSIEAGGIRGVVQTDEGAPIEEAIIYIEDTEGVIISTISNTTGSYSFDTTIPGAYHIWAFSEIHGSTGKELIAVFNHEWETHDIFFHDHLITVVFDPLNGREDVSPDEMILVRFSEPMNISTVNNDTLVFREVGKDDPLLIYYYFYPIEGDEEFGKSLIVMPYSLYGYNKTYELELSSEIMSLSGIPLGRNITLTFSTAPLLADLVISSYYPGPELENIPPDVTIHATFPQSLDPTTVNSSTVMVVDGTGNSILVDVTYSDVQRTIYIQPIDDLVQGEYYIVYLSPEIKPISPGYKVPTFTWSFQVEEKVGFGSIVGRLVNEDQEPFDPNVVEIRLTLGDELYRTPLIHENGSFEARGLETGIWMVNLYVYGYKEYRVNELVEENRTTYMGTITLYEGATSGTVNDGFDYQFISGACCILILLVLVIALFISNQKLRNDKEKNSILVEKLENLLDASQEE